MQIQLIIGLTNGKELVSEIMNYNQTQLDDLSLVAEHMDEVTVFKFNSIDNSKMYVLGKSIDFINIVKLEEYTLQN